MIALLVLFLSLFPVTHTDTHDVVTIAYRDVPIHVWYDRRDGSVDVTINDGYDANVAEDSSRVHNVWHIMTLMGGHHRFYEWHGDTLWVGTIIGDECSLVTTYHTHVWSRIEVSCP